MWNLPANNFFAQCIIIVVKCPRSIRLFHNIFVGWGGSLSIWESCRSLRNFRDKASVFPLSSQILYNTCQYLSKLRNTCLESMSQIKAYLYNQNQSSGKPSFPWWVSHLHEPVLSKRRILEMPNLVATLPKGKIIRSIISDEGTAHNSFLICLRNQSCRSGEFWRQKSCQHFAKRENYTIDNLRRRPSAQQLPDLSAEPVYFSEQPIRAGYISPVVKPTHCGHSLSVRSGDCGDFSQPSLLRTLLPTSRRNEIRDRRVRLCAFVSWPDTAPVPLTARGLAGRSSAHRRTTRSSSQPWSHPFAPSSVGQTQYRCFISHRF